MGASLPGGVIFWPHRASGGEMNGFQGFEEIDAAKFVGRCAEGINPDWMLIAGGNPQTGAACMTVSFGAFGFIWGRHIALAVVRQSRHTLPFILQNDAFSLAFFDPSWRDKLHWCGRHSGRDHDKIAHCGFTVLYDGNVPFFAQSQAVLICKLIYKDGIERGNFVDPAVFDEWYGHGVHKDDMHDMLYGAITRVLLNTAANPANT